MKQENKNKLAILLFSTLTMILIFSRF